MAGDLYGPYNQVDGMYTNGQSNLTPQQYNNMYTKSAAQYGTNVEPSFYDKLVGYNTAGADGQTIQHQGWGGLALGIGGLATNWLMGNKQLDFGREQLDFSKEQFQKNYAMQMDAYRRAANKNTGLLSYAQDRRDGTTDRNLSATLDAYNQGGQLMDSSGATISDPTYGAVKATPEASAFADPALTAAGQSALLNESMYGSSVFPSRDSARKSSTRDSNTEQQQDEQEKVKKITG